MPSWGFCFSVAVLYGATHSWHRDFANEANRNYLWLLTVIILLSFRTYTKTASSSSWAFAAVTPFNTAVLICRAYIWREERLPVQHRSIACFRAVGAPLMNSFLVFWLVPPCCGTLWLAVEWMHLAHHDLSARHFVICCHYDFTVLPLTTRSWCWCFMVICSCENMCIRFGRSSHCNDLCTLRFVRLKVFRGWKSASHLSLSTAQRLLQVKTMIQIRGIVWKNGAKHSS